MAKDGQERPIAGRLRIDSNKSVARLVFASGSS